jgi:hypothetical protein
VFDDVHKRVIVFIGTDTGHRGTEDSINGWNVEAEE